MVCTKGPQTRQYLEIVLQISACVNIRGRKFRSSFWLGLMCILAVQKTLCSLVHSYVPLILFFKCFQWLFISLEVLWGTVWLSIPKYCCKGSAYMLFCPKTIVGLAISVPANHIPSPSKLATRHTMKPTTYFCGTLISPFNHFFGSWTACRCCPVLCRVRAVCAVRLAYRLLVLLLVTV